MKTHPVCKLFPDMSEDQFKELVKDIEENGQLEPILTYKERIIDGRHRFKACKMLGIEPKFEEWKSDGSLVKFVVSCNLHRRHLSTSQKAMIATDMLPLLEKEAEMRKMKPLQEHREKVKGGKQSDDTSKDKGNKKRDPKRSAEDAAKSVGVSTSQVQKAKAIKKRAPELAEKVKKGEMSAHAAKKLADASPEERNKALKRAKKVGVKKALKDLPPKRRPPRELDESRIAANIDRVIKALEMVNEKVDEISASAKRLNMVPLKKTAPVKRFVSLSEKVATKAASLVGANE